MMMKLPNWSVPLYGTESLHVNLHWSFFAHFGLQVVNAILQHSDVPAYLGFIFLTYGPCLLFTIWITEYVRMQQAQRLDIPKEQDGTTTTATTTTTTTTTTATTTITTATPTTTTIWVGGDLNYVSKTKSVTQDIFFALIGPAVYFGQAIVWLMLCGLFDNFEFDDTLFSGVDYDEIDTFEGLFANTFAQCFWNSIVLVAFNLAVPAYPMDAVLLYAACWYRQGPNTVSNVCDGVAVIMLVGLLGYSIFDVLVEDDNGIGVFLLCIVGFLLAWIVEHHRCTNKNKLTSRTVLSRACYGITTEEEEEQQGTATTPSQGDTKNEHVTTTTTTEPEARTTPDLV